MVRWLRDGRCASAPGARRWPRRTARYEHASQAAILLCERGGFPDVAKVLDFGLVRQISGTTDPRLTAEDVLRGTPQYLAPEAIRNAENVDARSDLYALGAVGYYLLTGTEVFSGRGPLEIIHHHLQTEPESLSKRLARPVPPKLEKVILACLAKGPGCAPGKRPGAGRRAPRLRRRPGWDETDARSFCASGPCERPPRRRPDGCRLWTVLSAQSPASGPGPHEIDSCRIRRSLGAALADPDDCRTNQMQDHRFREPSRRRRVRTRSIAIAAILLSLLLCDGAGAQAELESTFRNAGMLAFRAGRFADAARDFRVVRSYAGRPGRHSEALARLALAEQRRGMTLERTPRSIGFSDVERRFESYGRRHSSRTSRRFKELLVKRCGRDRTPRGSDTTPRSCA